MASGELPATGLAAMGRVSRMRTQTAGGELEILRHQRCCGQTAVRNPYYDDLVRSGRCHRDRARRCLAGLRRLGLHHRGDALR